MSLLNKNFSNHADSQVEVHRTTFEQSHLVINMMSALSSQKVVSD